MQLIKKLLKARGFSMPELMIGVGILGGISLVTMKMLENQSSNESYLKFVSDVNITTTQVQTYLNDINRCQTMLAGYAKSATVNPGLIADTLTQLAITQGGKTKVIMRENTVYSRSFISFYIPPQGIRLGSSSFGATSAELVITFNLRSASIMKRRDTTGASDMSVTKRIPFVASFNADGVTIKACGPVVSDANSIAKQKLCNAFIAKSAAYWDGSNCIFNPNPATMKCTYPYVVRAVSNLGELQCDHVLDRLTLEEVFDFTGVDCRGALNFYMTTTGGGKVKPTCAINTGLFYWYTGAWGACANSMQTRYVTCMNSSSNTPVSDSYCSGAGAKPGDTMACSENFPTS